MQPHPPARPVAFVGRDLDLDRLAALLLRVTCAGIYGVAGVGKSTLAHAVAARWPGPVVQLKVTQDEPLAVLVDHVRR